MARNTGTNLTMAGLRLAEAEMKAAKTQQEQKPLSAIIVALAEKEMKAPTMAELRQYERSRKRSSFGWHIRYRPAVLGSLF